MFGTIRRRLSAGAIGAATARVRALRSRATSDRRPARRPAQRVVGYFPIWLPPSGYSARDVDFSIVSQIAHFAVVPRDDGSIEIPDWGPFPDHQLLATAHAAGARVSLVVGGDHEAARAGFSAMVASTGARAAFVGNVLRLVIAEGYDGVDLDWEFPSSAEDRTGFTTLTRELRVALGSSRTLSLAAPASDYFGQWFDVRALLPNLDWISAMTYGLSAPGWSASAGHNAPLYNPGQDGDGPIDALSVESSRRYYLARGVPPQKLLIGLPFYGQRFDGAGALYQSLTNRDGGALSYRAITALVNNGWTARRDAAASVPYLTDPTGGSLISYDDPASIRAKVAYGAAHGLGGVIIWSLGQDQIGSGQPLLQAVKEGYGSRR